MRRTLPTAAALSALSALLLGSATWMTTPAQAEGAAESYIVVLDATTPDPGAVSRDHAVRHGAAVSHVYGHAVRGYAATLSPAAARRVASDSRVAYVSVDRTVSVSRQTLPNGINRIDGELSSTVSGNGSGTVNVDVAVLDTGVDLTHPDLNVVGGKNCSTGRSADDMNGHGTHVAGTIAAKDDGVGVVGVAPGARVWPVRVLNNAGSGSWSNVICGVDYVTANASQIEVANMSLGGSGVDDGNCGRSNNDPLHAAICASVAAGVTYAVAAGNESDNAAHHVPAAYDEVITVSALVDFDGLAGGVGAATCGNEVDDTFAVFSNYGPDVDIIAPGTCILSTWKHGGYDTISGTSMATPHVAGAAALYRSYRKASPAHVRTALQNAGNLNWNAGDDPDGIKENLLNVDAL